MDGTSASAPAFAGLVSLFNHARVSQQPPLPPLGFLNPLLYQTHANSTRAARERQRHDKGRAAGGVISAFLLGGDGDGDGGGGNGSDPVPLPFSDIVEGDTACMKNGVCCSR